MIRPNFIFYLGWVKEKSKKNLVKGKASPFAFNRPILSKYVPATSRAASSTSAHGVSFFSKIGIPINKALLYYNTVYVHHTILLLVC